MDGADKAWDYLTKLPQLLNQYSSFSYPLLTVLLAGGLLIMAVQIVRWRKKQPGLPGTALLFGVALMFLSGSGFFLKYIEDVQIAQARTAFVDSHRVPPGEHWLLVFDFTPPAASDAAAQQRYLTRMENLVAAMSEVLLEDLPSDFRQPRVVRVPTVQSPWPEGVDQENFDQVMRELNAFEIIWGSVREQGDQVKAFLGLPSRLADDLDTIIPLRDFALDNPRRDQQFGDGYYRLLGLVTLGMALDTYHRAGDAAGDARRRQFLLAAQQFNKARELVNNRRHDPLLQRNLYSSKVDVLIRTALNEAGLAP